MKLNNHYNLTLKLVNPNIEEGFLDIEESPRKFKVAKRDFFHNAVERFNEISIKSRTNKRRLRILSYENDRIQIKLSCEKEIDYPGRAIKYLSQLLINESTEDNDFFQRALYHKKLFEIIVSAETSNEFGTTITEPTSVSDEKLIHALISYLLKPKVPYTKELNQQRKAWDEIKIKAVESGIIKI